MESRESQGNGDDSGASHIKGVGLHSKSKGFKSLSGKDLFFRADKIDLKNLDIQLEKGLNKVWSRDKTVAQRPKDEWEIDLSKLNLRYVVARGTFGTVYRGNYDNQDVAGYGNFAISFVSFFSVSSHLVICVLLDMGL